MNRRLTAALAAALTGILLTSAHYIRNPYDDIVVPFRLDITKMMLDLAPLDPDNLGIEVRVLLKDAYKLGTDRKFGDQIPIYMEPLPEDLGQRTHLDFDWWNVNDATNGYNRIEFVTHWKGLEEADFFQHPFKAPNNGTSIFTTTPDDWINITDKLGAAKCRVADFYSNQGLNGAATRTFGLAGDEAIVVLNKPMKMGTTIVPTPPNTFVQRIRNWRYYNPEHAGQRWDVSFTNPRQWDQVYVYAWGMPSSGAKNYTGVWPGTPLQLTDDTSTYDAAFKVVDAYGIQGITFSNGLGEYIKFADDTALDPVNGQTYSELLLAMRLLTPLYDDWQDIYAYSPDGRLGQYPGTLMTPWPEGGTPHGVFRAPRRTVEVNGEDYRPYYVEVPSYEGNDIEVCFTGKDASGNIVGRYPAEDSGQWIPLSDYQCFTLGAHPNPGAITGAEDASADVLAPVIYYNLQGQPMTAPLPGQTVIRRQGTSVTKIIYKR